MMHESDTSIIEGSYEELGWLIGCAPEIVARCCIELQRTKTADVTLGNGNVTLISRRLRRELNIRKQTRSRVQRHRNAECNADVTTQSKSNKKEVINKSKKDENDFGKNGRPSNVENSIYVGTVLDGITKSLGLKKLSHSQEREWILAADLCFENGFTAAEFVGCFNALGEKKDYAIIPKYVIDQLPVFVNKNGKPKDTKPQWQVDIDLCSLCDERGYRDIDGELKTCKHG